MREKLIKLLINSPGLDVLFGSEEEFAKNADWLIANDVVPVVRCKDCKFCRTFFPEKQIGKEARQVWYCDLYRCNRKTDEFCSDGERREEA